MNTYEISIKFKQGKSLEFKIETDKDLKGELTGNWEANKKDGAITIGDYLIATDDIQWIRIKGEVIKETEIFEKHSGK